MTQFNSENEMSDQVSMYFDTLGELEEKDQEAIQNKYQHILEHLDENNVPFEIIDFMETPLKELELKTLLKKLNTDVQGLIRKNDRIYQERYMGKNFSEDEWIKILVENPALIQRPILIKGSVAMVGRPIENVRFFIEQ